MGEILRRRYKVRSQSEKYKQITLPPECYFEPGQRVTVIHDGWVVIVPMGTAVDEQMIDRAIGLKETK